MVAAKGLAHFFPEDEDTAALNRRKSCCTCCSILAVATSLIFVSGLVLEKMPDLMLMPMGGLRALSLVGLASTCFVVCGVTMLQWAPTAQLGHTLIHRVTHTRSNWETDTLRSFLEVGIWLGVIWFTFQKIGGGAVGLVVALICSTLAGCLLATTGDLLTGPLRDLDVRSRREESASDFMCTGGQNLCITSGSMMLLALYGHGAIHTIYNHCHDAFVACVLAATAGLALLTVSKLIQFWRPMRHAGYTMQTRITNTAENWRTNPVRSAIESTFWGGILIGTYQLDSNFFFALQVATASGIVICLSSELFWNGLLDRCVPRQKSAPTIEIRPAVAPACIFAYGVLALCGVIFAQAHHWMTATLLSTIAGVAFTAAGKVALRWAPTAKAGAVINGRVINTAENWAEYPLRSFLEVSLWLLATWGIFAKTHSVFVATGAGALTGVAVALTNEEFGWGAQSVEKIQETCAAEPVAKAPVVAAENLGGPTARASSSSKKQKSYSWLEIAKHNSPDDIWFVIDGNVYDVSSWASQHPGGSIIYKFAGVDASDQFAAFHMPRVAKRLPRFLIGRLDETSEGGGDTSRKPSAATLEYRALREKLWREGYFESRTSYYVGKTFVWVGLFSSAVAVILCSSPSYFWLRTVGSGVLMGIGLQQVAFMGHDAAHYGISKQSSGGGFNWLSWTLASAFFGISTSMWNEEHSMHHAITLRPQEDPQFNYLPIWLISMKELDVPGTKVDFLMRALVRIQHYTFLPLIIIIGRFNFYLISLAFALKRLIIGPDSFKRIGGLADVVGMAIFWTWFGSVLLLLDSRLERITFLLASHWSCGILHVQLLLSHLMTETFSAEEERAEQFFAFQMKTTRNIDSFWYDHWFHGGLEYQIEHHLFPQLPRHNLKRVKPMVQEICKRHGIPYESTSFSAALIHIMKDMRQLAHAILTLEQG